MSCDNNDFNNNNKLLLMLLLCHFVTFYRREGDISKTCQHSLEEAISINSSTGERKNMLNGHFPLGIDYSVWGKFFGYVCLSYRSSSNVIQCILVFHRCIFDSITVKKYCRNVLFPVTGRHNQSIAKGLLYPTAFSWLRRTNSPRSIIHIQICLFFVNIRKQLKNVVKESN